MSDQSGRVFVVTGANSGLGFETTKALASHGGAVVMACRNLQKAENAKNQILSMHPDANLVVMKLDLGDLASIKEFSEQFKSAYDRLDVLYNNAGLMAIPFQKTKDGFEMTIGVNHFGHFALTGLLIDHLLKTSKSRVVTVSSNFHKRGKINFEDINYEKRKYRKWEAYAQSKLANLMFTLELQDLLKGKETISVAAHPGYARTHLQEKGAELANNRIRKLFGKIGNVFAQSAYMGALPQIYAGVGEDVTGGDYFGPSGFMEMRGYPKKVKPHPTALNKEERKRLWKLSEELTGIVYPFE